MDAVKVPARISDDRKLIVDLPSDIPVGLVDVIIFPKQISSLPAKMANGTGNLRRWFEQREQMRIKLARAQGQDEVSDTSEGYIPLSDEERMRLTVLPVGMRSTDELVDEDRGLR